MTVRVLLLHKSVQRFLMWTKIPVPLFAHGLVWASMQNAPAQVGCFRIYFLLYIPRSRVCLCKSFSNLWHHSGAKLSSLSVSVRYLLQGGNDYEIYSDPRTIGHEVSCPEETQQLCQQLFFSWERGYLTVVTMCSRHLHKTDGKDTGRTSSFSFFAEIWLLGLITKMINWMQKVSWCL